MEAEHKGRDITYICSGPRSCTGPSQGLEPPPGPSRSSSSSPSSSEGPSAAARKCLLLALSVALVCGSQDTNVPQIMGDLDVQEPPGLSCHRLPGRGGRCLEKKLLAESTRCAGRFNIHYLEENQVVVLDTDYKNRMFVCVENTAAPSRAWPASTWLSSRPHGPGTDPGPAARTPKLSEVAMEKFDSAMKLLPSHIQLLFTPTRAEERCLV
uniref:Lipocalin/cytosolic fatty-acid binding domain-containing protein n=1 Tax=Molossus molossus TaxID=27622 RepID=A0A7J8EF60_MOLMO|nr:hypothetical protein HJG59_013772 [Molossus molossus]